MRPSDIDKQINGKEKLERNQENRTFAVKCVVARLTIVWLLLLGWMLLILALLFVFLLFLLLLLLLLLLLRLLLLLFLLVLRVIAFAHHLTFTLTFSSATWQITHFHFHIFSGWHATVGFIAL